MVWEQEEVCNHGIYPGREATFFYCRTSGIVSSICEKEFFLSSNVSFTYDENRLSMTIPAGVRSYLLLKFSLYLLPSEVIPV